MQRIAHYMGQEAMKITRLSASNWRNFKSLDFPLDSRLFVVGPNAAGKSNLLDLFRFLSDLARPGGGLMDAIQSRGGLSKVRSLFSRNYKRGQLIIEVELDDGADIWRYRLAVRGQKGGRNLPIVAEERVEKNGEVLLSRPNRSDESDELRLTQTHLEQIGYNQEFRALADYFSKIRYFHLVPQIIRDPARAGLSKGDPFGGDFIAQMNTVSPRTRDAWLGRMEKALQAAVPEFESLRLEVDPAGQPHLVAGYRNWRTTPARQSEADFSDGTLRLIGLLWVLVSSPANGGLILLEEPELSLNSNIVKMLPSVLATAQRHQNMQVVLSTHAPELLDDEGVDAEEVLLLQVTEDGTSARVLSSIQDVVPEIDADLPLSDIINDLTAPENLAGLVTVGRTGRR